MGCSLLLLTTESGAQSSAEKAIRQVMAKQAASWNQGDIEGFMRGYWVSDSLMFIGSQGITRGYDSTKARYYKAYPDRAAMGQLAFDILRLESLGAEAYSMVGRWNLTRKKDRVGGYFTLLFRCIDGQWVITQDHTSQRP